MKFVIAKGAVIIVGEGPEKERLEKLSKELGLSDRVFFAGYISHKNIPSYYSIIDIFVVPRINSRVCHIVTPLKPLEAMAMGKCVLASNVGGLKELIVDGKTGLLFDPENVADLSQKINYLIKHEQYRNEIGERASEFVREQRNWDVLCKKYIEIYLNQNSRDRSSMLCPN